MKIILKRRIAAALVCAAALFSLSSCSKVEEDTSFSSPEVPPTTVEVTKGGSVNIPAGFKSPTEFGQMATGFTGSEMFGGFSVVSTTKTEYFTTSGSITVNFNALLFKIKDNEATPATVDKEFQNVAFAIFRKNGDDTIYEKTALFPADGETHNATFTGLDPAAQYRFVITYTDVSRTRTTGTFSASGITSPPAAEPEDSSSEPAA